MIRGSKEIAIQNEIFCLLPDGALYWPKHNILAIADFHLGKVETFQKNGFNLPFQAQDDDILRLISLSQIPNLKTILFLGDLIHTYQGLTLELQKKFIQAMSPFSGELILIAGNHDRTLIKNWPSEWKKISVVTHWEKDHFLFQHEPPTHSKINHHSNFFIWAGHIHPCVCLKGWIDRLRLKTFVVREKYGILPAFSNLAGGYEIIPDSKTKLYPFSEGEVFCL